MRTALTNTLACYSNLIFIEVLERNFSPISSHPFSAHD
uniref:Uncharacterized protein n=1 Tax=Siphoviridae sp. ctYh54 TaxID=2826379 RepID=A0A8S5MDR8_9CAUD|nr:MAG TPA: hypothetical protein [Siphoviridae sp. ctYh54]